MMNKKIKLLTTSIVSGFILVATVATISQFNKLQLSPVSALNDKSFTFDKSVANAYFSDNRFAEKTISNGGSSSDIHAGIYIKNGYTSDVNMGGDNYFLEKQSYAMSYDFNFLVGVNNITSFSLSFRMANYSNVMSASSIRYNSYVYFYDEDYNISTALNGIASGNDNYVDPIYSSENIGSVGVEKNTVYTVSWNKPNEATYTARHMRLYFSLYSDSGNKDTYSNIQFINLTVNWKC